MPLLACVIAAWLMQPPTKSAGAGQADPWKSVDLRDWLGAAAEHQPGVEDAPMRKIAGWSGGKLLRTLESVRREVPTDRLNDLLERAAVLHGDIMLLSRESNPRWTDVPDTTSSLLVADGQRVGQQALDPHIRFARAVFMAMREPAVANPSREDRALSWEESHRRNPRIHQWYRAVSSDLAARHWLADLRPHLADARRVLDDSAGTMFDTACLSEAIASAEVQRALPQGTSPSQMSTIARRANSEMRLLDEDINLSEAERYYRDAIKLDPLHDEARVRLARVLSRRSHHGQALELLQAPMGQPEAAVRYYGALARGEAAEATRKPDLARRAYEEAAQLFPNAQSPLLALMRLARERGDDPTAKEIAARFAQLGPHEHSRFDPWWDYFDCNGRNSRIELERLWALYRAKPGNE